MDQLDAAQFFGTVLAMVRCGSSVGAWRRTCPSRFVFLSRQNAHREARKGKKKAAGENGRSSIFLIKHNKQLSNMYMAERVFSRSVLFVSSPACCNCSYKEMLRVLRRDGVFTGGAIVQQKWLGYQIVSFLCDGLRCVTSLFCAFPVVCWANAFFRTSCLFRQKEESTRHRKQGTSHGTGQAKANRQGELCCLFVCLLFLSCFVGVFC